MSTHTPQKTAHVTAHAHTQSNSALLDVQHLHKAFGGNQAVNDVSFNLQAGELLALIGPNGAGKSTTFNLVNGQLAPDSGSITLDGVSLLGRQPHELWHMGVSRTFQMAQTFGSLTVAENVQMALLSADGKSLAPWQRATHYRRADALHLLEQRTTALNSQHQSADRGEGHRHDQRLLTGAKSLHPHVGEQYGCPGPPDCQMQRHHTEKPQFLRSC